MNYDALQRRIMDFFRNPDAGAFGELALAIFGFQYAHNAGYRAYCDVRASAPDRVGTWQAIPAVPGDVFKDQPPPFCGDPAQAERSFLSSGTTGETRGRHCFREVATYRSSILAGWQACHLPPLTQTAFVSRPPGSHPDSSLMFMLETLAAGAAATAWLLDPDGSPRYPTFSGSPLVLFGTTLNLLDYLAHAPEGFALPPDTWVFQTGGYKGLQGQVDPAEVKQLLTAAGVAGDHVINEYGMTELSSQAYAVGEGAAHQCPPWMRVRVIDPETGSEQPFGVEGYLEIVDLANLGSVLAVRTQDIATAISHSEFVLRGRDDSALPRGCSRSAEAALSLS